MARREAIESLIEAQTRRVHGFMYNIWKELSETAKEADGAYNALLERDVKATHPAHDIWAKQVKLYKLVRAFYTFIANAYNPDNLKDPAVFLENLKRAERANEKAGAVMIDLLDMTEDLADNGPGVKLLAEQYDGPPTEHHNAGAHIEFATLIKEQKEARDSIVREAYSAHGKMTATGFVDRA